MDLNGGLWTNLYLGRGPFLPVQNKYLTMDVTGKLLHSQASLPDGRRYATLQQGTSLHPLWWIQWPCWPGTENNWRYRFHIFLAYVCGNIPTKYGLIWYNTSNLGSWNSHWWIDQGEKQCKMCQNPSCMGRKHPTDAQLPWQSNKKWLENHLPRANLPQLGSQVLLNLATYQESRFSHGPINGEPKDISIFV